MVGVAPSTFQVLCTYQGRDHFFRQEVWSGREEVKTRHVIPLFSTCTIVYSVFPTLTMKLIKNVLIIESEVSKWKVFLMKIMPKNNQSWQH